MKKIVIVLISCFVFAGLLFETGIGSENYKSGKDDSEHHGENESKISGKVEKLPQDLIGTWVVEGKEIVVTKDTVIKEDHGKPAVGVYVEVEGYYTEKTFTARKIEIKGAHK